MKSRIPLGVITILIVMSSLEAKEELLAHDKAFADLSLEKGYLVAFAAYLHPDVIMLSDGKLPTFGLSAALDGLRSGADDFDLAWVPQDGEIARSDDMGYTWGYWELWPKGKAGQGEALVSGKYLNVWRRDASGAWKVLVDIGNTNGPTKGSESTE